MSAPENTPAVDADPLAGAQVFLAKSHEVIVIHGDPKGLASPHKRVVGHTLVIGVYSTVANAEAALDARNARMRDMAPLTQFTPHGTTALHRRLPSPADAEGAEQWQMIDPATIDLSPL